jgi:hypothetical protein
MLRSRPANDISLFKIVKWTVYRVKFEIVDAIRKLLKPKDSLKPCSFVSDCTRNRSS